MQNKFFILTSITILSLVGLFVFSGTTYAISDSAAAKFSCTLNYGAGASQPFTTYKNSCCPVPADEPIDGKLCYDDGKVLRETSDAAVAFCSDPAFASSASSVEAIARDVYTKNWKGFNCLRGTKDTTCRDSSYCRNSTGACQTFGGDVNSCVATKKRNVECDSSCSACLPNYTYCGMANNVCQKTKVGPNKDFDDITPDTATKYPCSVFGAQADPCTGTCLCPVGYTYSGRQLGQCVPFFVRFSEIFEDGLTWLGGVRKIIHVETATLIAGVLTGGVVDKEQATYDYSLTNNFNAQQQDVYLKSDVAYNLDWSNPNLPAPIRSLINNYYHTCNIVNGDADCPTGEKCGTDGLCYGTGSVGAVCGNSSQCNYGLFCDATGHCALPNPGLLTCTSDANCTAPQKCGSDNYCHDPAGGVGDPCTTSANCAAGLYCASNNKCATLDSMTGIQYVGMTSTNAFATSLSGYAAANDKCNNATPATTFQGSHVCTVEEMLFLVNNNPSSLPTSDQAWINGGPPGYTATANDCAGWTNKTSTAYGRYWNFNIVNPNPLDATGGWIRRCTMTNVPFACCK